MTGEFGRATMTLRVNIQCAENYFGSACQFLCNADGTGCIPGKSINLINNINQCQLNENRRFD